MLKKFKQHLQNHFAFALTKRFLIATSGGIDSMVLVDLMLKSNYKIIIAHCNFNLRGSESDGDEQFVRQFCESKNIEYFIQSFDTNQFSKDFKVSTQIAARQLRYEWFENLRAQQQLDFIVTAHHADDVLETFLINLSRGSGLDGLVGIPAINGNILRVLLPFSREEIENYAQEHHILWREDSSNSSHKYVRNQIRHQVIPVLKSINPSLLDSFQNSLTYLKQAQSLVFDASGLVYKKVVEDQENLKKINIQELKRLPNFEAYLYQWLSPLGFTAWKDIYELVNASSGKQIFSSSFRILKDREYLLISPIIEEINNVIYITNSDISIDHPIKLVISNELNPGNIDNSTIFVDSSLLNFPLSIRKWKQGDYFFPVGMNGKKKKISKYFKDEKFSLFDKENTWLLCSNEEIIWIIGHRADERFLAHKNTKNTIKFNFSK